MKPLNQQTIDWVNELLPKASPIGAYSVGMGCTACVQAGIKPTRHFLAALAKSTSIEAAEAFIDSWIEEEGQASAAGERP